MTAVPEMRLNSTGRTMAIVVPVKDGLNYLGDIDAQIAPDDTLLVSVPRFIELLERRLDTRRIEALRGLVTVDDFAPLSALDQVGLPMQFDKQTLELSVNIAVQDRAERTIALAELDRPIIGEFAQPEAFSAYVNMRGSLDYVEKGTNTGLGDPFLLFDGAARFDRFVLESEGVWDGRDNQFGRSGSRLVFDDAPHLMRWTAGDLISQNHGFQGLLDIAGVGIARTYALLDPQRNVAPRGGQTFSLDRDATVEAFVNGRSVRTIRLQPGTYNVSDFPFAQGGNDVELVITDDTGRRDVISFTLFIERTQLAKGLSEFSFNAGVLTRRTDGVDYSNDPALSGFYRRGLTDRLTLGGNVQYAGKGYLAGAEMVLGTDWGTIGGDVAFSHLPSTGGGWAANFSIERVTRNLDQGSSLIATVEARSRRFGAVGQLQPNNPYRLNGTVSYNRSIGSASFIGAQLRYAMARSGFVDEYAARASYGRRFGRRTNVIFDAEWNRGFRGDDQSFRISLVRRFGSRSSARAEFDSRDNGVRLGYQSSAGYGVGSWSGAANLDIADSIYNLNASGNYVANRADIGLAHTGAFEPGGDTISDQRTSLRMATSLAFAGGAFAVGRPISDSFAIFKPHRRGEGLSIEVEQSEDSYQARSGVFGPALYGQVGSYSPRTLTYDVPNASAGLDIGTGSLRMLSPYRAGYVVTVGSDYNLMVIGRLKDRGGEPLALRAGMATEIGGDRRQVELFTNRQGQFALSGVKAGRWRIEMAGSPPVVYELDLAESSSGIARVGEIAPEDER